ncbi:MAG TPA: FtsQ-type POTRA domain-containing protein, partial [Bdellovibrionota bacterium]|nr:FtsQ-type POTRA domain-containing protein [Bdellovibrionota bacterium]
MKSLVPSLVLLASCAALAAVGYGVRSAALSPLFTVQVVEVTEAGASSRDAGPGRESPVSSQAIVDLAGVPVGHLSLFELDLAAIEKRVLSHEWVRSVRLWKSFPETLAIEVTYKSPQAVFQSGNGGLAYVDVDGRPFGRVSLDDSRDLPVLSGFAGKPPEAIEAALGLLGRWEDAPAARFSRISSIT